MQHFSAGNPPSKLQSVKEKSHVSNSVKEKKSSQSCSVEVISTVLYMKPHKGSCCNGQRRGFSEGGSVEAVGRLLIVHSKVLGNVAVISSEDGLRVDRNVITYLLDHCTELRSIFNVLVAAVQAHLVLSLKLGPDRFLHVKTRAICWLKCCVKATHLFCDLVTAVSWCIVHNEIGTSAIRVAKLLGQCNEETLHRRDVCVWELHVELASFYTLSHCSVQMDCRQIFLVLRSNYRPRPSHEGLRWFVPHPERGCVKVKKLVSVGALQRVQLATEVDPLLMYATLSCRRHSLALLRLQVFYSIAFVHLREDLCTDT